MPGVEKVLSDIISRSDPWCVRMILRKNSRDFLCFITLLFDVMMMTGDVCVLFPVHAEGRHGEDREGP